MKVYPPPHKDSQKELCFFQKKCKNIFCSGKNTLQSVLQLVLKKKKTLIKLFIQCIASLWYWRITKKIILIIILKQISFNVLWHPAKVQWVQPDKKYSV